MAHSEFENLLRKELLLQSKITKGLEVSQKLARPALRMAPDQTLLIVKNCTRGLMTVATREEKTILGATILSDAQQVSTTVNAVIGEKVLNSPKGSHRQLRTTQSINPKKIERAKAQREKRK